MAPDLAGTIAAGEPDFDMDDVLDTGDETSVSDAGGGASTPDQTVDTSTSSAGEGESQEGGSGKDGAAAPPPASPAPAQPAPAQPDAAADAALKAWSERTGIPMGQAKATLDAADADFKHVIEQVSRHAAQPQGQGAAAPPPAAAPEAPPGPAQPQQPLISDAIWGKVADEAGEGTAQALKLMAQQIERMQQPAPPPPPQPARPQQPQAAQQRGYSPEQAQEYANYAMHVGELAASLGVAKPAAGKIHAALDQAIAYSVHRPGVKAEEALLLATKAAFADEIAQARAQTAQKAAQQNQQKRRGAADLTTARSYAPKGKNDVEKLRDIEQQLEDSFED